MQDLAPGSRYGSFQIITKLGRGLTGPVYKAVYTRDGSEVALKFLEERDESVTSYFFNEMGLLRRAKEHGRNHTHLIEYVASYTTQKPFCLATRFYEGQELTEVLTSWVAPGLALRIIEQVAGALDYLHHGHPDAPVVHRDVKPGNIMVNSAGDALLIDLSAGKYPGFMRENERSLGTPQYMPPEQYEGDEQPQTDQFALAMVAYQLLSGKALLGGHADREQKQMRALRDSGYARIRQGLPKMPATADVIIRAVAYEWTLRYATCEEFAYELRRALVSDGISLDLMAPVPVQHKYKQWLAYGAMGVAVVIALLMLLMNPFQASPPQVPGRTVNPPTATLAVIQQPGTGANQAGFAINPPGAGSVAIDPTTGLAPTTSIAAPSTASLNTGGSVSPARSGCALRNIPSTDGSIIPYSAESRLIPSGVTLTILEQRNTWYNVRLPDERTGWCPDYQLNLGGTR